MRIEHFNSHTAPREYRACGRFNAREVAELLNHGLDARDHGCPPALFERILEKRAAFRNRHSDVAREQWLHASLTRAAVQDKAIGPVTDDDRRARLQNSLAKTREQDTAAWLKGLL